MRAQFDMQVDLLTELARAGIDALRRLSELNVHLVRQLNDDAVNAARAMLSCGYPFQPPVVAASEAAPFIGHLRSYQQQLGGLLSGVQMALARQAPAPTARPTSCTISTTRRSKNRYTAQHGVHPCLPTVSQKAARRSTRSHC
ncbi:hypothetical protein PO883_14035 [Massilia sp. DJPM01]|uniref:hypothetical protein n=1 Tax=Massilia sp. DJPM01 TaxID=3024404 RepID=UPI00259EB4BF|nr:hypothetical protein [Massilia sp. DJPM01]MDM5178314.1 hypothetical protein [Massilia sp. DJPM01]